MPRPKVLPEERQRAYRACAVCKASKIRCDSELPCSSCVKRGRESSCIYSDTERRRRTRTVPPQTNPSQPQTRPKSQPQQPIQRDFSVPPPVNNNPPAHLRTPSVSSNGNTVEVDAPWSKGPSIPPSGERGNSAETGSLSFLYFLRRTLKPYVGLIRFTDIERDNAMQEIEVQHVVKESLECPPAKMYQLLDYYFEATSGLFDLFTADEIDALVDQRSRLIDSETLMPLREDLAALDAALAIGAQVLPLDKSDPQLEEALFSRARHIAFEGMLTKPNLSMVRLFLLLTFYMLGANQRNAAAMYLGIATRAAVVLGLDNPRNLSVGNLDLRSRTWTSLRILDVLASFILGRPQNLVTSTREPNTPYDSITWSGNATFAAMSQGCSLIENIVQVLRKGSMLDVPNAEDLLNQLRNWNQSLPESVRQFTFGNVSSLEAEDRQGLMSSVHISCLYYFGVILITRPFLIAYLMSRLRGRAPDHLINDPEEASDLRLKNNKVARLAQVCFSAATYMAETLQSIKRSNFTFGNFCMVKAWIFGSGLVLGFSRFAGDRRQDIEDAFSSCQDILSTMAQTCHQARVYHDVLSSFAEAIQKYRQRISLESRRTVQHYMDQVLVVDHLGSSAQGGFGSTAGGATASGFEISEAGGDGAGGIGGLLDNSSAVPGMEFGVGETTQFGDGYLDGFMIDWAEFDMQSLGELNADFGPLKGLLCSVE